MNQCRLDRKSRLPCPFGQAGTSLSLTVTLSEVEGCLKIFPFIYR
jgi:hypothetical protein